MVSEVSFEKFWKFLGGGGVIEDPLEWKILGGWGGANRRVFRGGGIDSFWNHTFELPAEVAVTWWKRLPYLIWQYWLSVLGNSLSVTSQLKVESSID